MKPLYGRRRRAVFKMAVKDPNFGSLFDLFARPSASHGWCSASCRGHQGDKRIILVDGEALGAVNRVPAGDDIRSNMVRGGAAARPS